MHELNISMQRSMEYIIYQPHPLGPMCCFCTVHRPLHETEVQRKRVGAPHIVLRSASSLLASRWWGGGGGGGGGGGVQMLEWIGMEWTTGMACKVQIPSC